MLLPRPTTYRADDGEFSLTESTVIRVGDRAALSGTARWLQSALRPSTGFPLPAADVADAGGVGAGGTDAASSGAGDSAISLSLNSALGAEAYELSVDASSVRIAGGDAAGVFYGCQALLQLLPPAVYRRGFVADARWSVPAVTITDAPRFGWRGAMIDVSRHFMAKREVLRFIDLLAVHRLNVLHFHLTDDQGWRIEIKRYPKLASVASWRRESQVGAGPTAGEDGRPHGGFYTQEDIREIVAYAAARHITVVPEIDLPGHSQAAISAYPELGIDPDERLEVWTRWGVNHNVLNGEEHTIEFFKGVLDELMDLFPSELIGLGGDECPKDRWENDARTQELIRERGLGNEKGLQAWIIGRLASTSPRAGAGRTAGTRCWRAPCRRVR